MSALSGIARILKGSMMMVLPFLILKESCPSQLILTPWYSNNRSHSFRISAYTIIKPSRETVFENTHKSADRRCFGIYDVRRDHLRVGISRLHSRHLLMQSWKKDPPRCGLDPRWPADAYFRCGEFPWVS